MSRRPRPTGAIHVVTNRRQGKGREYVTHLLRRSYREGGKVRNERVGNISHLPEELVELVRAGLRGELAKFGYSCDQKRGTRQIIYGLLCDEPGRPIAVEVFSCELHDDKTLPSQIEKLKARFGLDRVLVVSDRGMVTKANLELHTA